MKVTISMYALKLYEYSDMNNVSNFDTISFFTSLTILIQSLVLIFPGFNFFLN